jgi:hypothetical protein
MDKLYPIVRRVRRPLLPPDHEPQRRRGAEMETKTAEPPAPEEKQTESADEAEPIQ